MTKFNYKRLLICFTILIAISVFCFFVIFASEESDFGNEASDGLFSYVFVSTCKALFSTIAYPELIAWHFGWLLNGLLYFVGVAVGALIDTLLIELAIVKYKGFKTKSEIEHPSR